MRSAFSRTLKNAGGTRPAHAAQRQQQQQQEQQQQQQEQEQQQQKQESKKAGVRRPIKTQAATRSWRAVAS
jgi:transcription initiation factor TFIID subunit TAF12